MLLFVKGFLLGINVGLVIFHGMKNPVRKQGISYRNTVVYMYLFACFYLYFHCGFSAGFVN